jgi:GNAT superfamily N-acetyltransferase
MTGYWVRPATPNDVKAMRELARSVGREFRVSGRWHERSSGFDHQNLVWVVEAGRGKIVGSCAVREHDHGVWDLHSLFLAPEYRGIGLGRALAEHALRTVRQEGGLTVRFRAADEFREAHTLVQRLGFVEHRPRPPGGERSFELTLGRAS